MSSKEDAEQTEMEQRVVSNLVRQPGLRNVSSQPVCGGGASPPRLVAVSKTKPVNLFARAMTMAIAILEKTMQELLGKGARMPDDTVALYWAFDGNRTCKGARERGSKPVHGGDGGHGQVGKQAGECLQKLRSTNSTTESHGAGEYLWGRIKVGRDPGRMRDPRQARQGQLSLAGACWPHDDRKIGRCVSRVLRDACSAASA